MSGRLGLANNQARGWWETMSERLVGSCVGQSGGKLPKLAVVNYVQEVRSGCVRLRGGCTTPRL